MTSDCRHATRVTRVRLQVLNDPEHHKFFLRIELCDGGQCLSGDGPMQPLSEEIARGFFKDLIVGPQQARNLYTSNP